MISLYNAIRVRRIILFISLITTILLSGCGGGKDVDQKDIKLDLTTTVSTVAGSISPGKADGIATAASFFNPRGMASDGSSLFIADNSNHLIRKIDIKTGKVTTHAGTGSPGNIDGTGTAASFYTPRAITTDGTYLYIADLSNHSIRQIDITTSVVKTLTGSGVRGSSDGLGTSATFNNPSGITIDGNQLYVVDSSNNKIRKIQISTGVVTTFAGTGAVGHVNGLGQDATFSAPSDITNDGSHLYVTDTMNHVIRKISMTTGVVTTLAGSGVMGRADDIGKAASFYHPRGIISHGNRLYVADTNNHSIREVVISTAAVSTIAGTGFSGYVDHNIGKLASFNNPSGISTDGIRLFVSDSFNHIIRRID